MEFDSIQNNLTIGIVKVCAQNTCICACTDLNLEFISKFLTV